MPKGEKREKQSALKTIAVVAERMKAFEPFQ